MLRRRNRRTEARELLAEAVDVAHRSGAAPLAERAETGSAPPGRVSASDAHGDRRADGQQAPDRQLASQGLTNREIAQTLFVTARTVEGHLTSIFRKLQLDSRNELPAALARRTPVPASRTEGRDGPTR